MTNQLSIHYIDEDGAKGVHRMPVRETLEDPADVVVGTLVTALGNVSSAGVEKTTLLWDKFPGLVTPGTGPYDVEDKMITAFNTAVGTALRIAIPAPIRALMATNDESWSAGEALIDTLATAVANVVVTKGGSIVTGIKKSFRSRRNRRQR